MIYDFFKVVAVVGHEVEKFVRSQTIYMYVIVIPTNMGHTGCFIYK